MRSKTYVHRRNVGGTVIAEKRRVNGHGMPVNIKKIFNGKGKGEDSGPIPTMENMQRTAQAMTVKSKLPEAVPLTPLAMSTQERIDKAFSKMNLNGSGSKPATYKQSGNGIRFL